MCVSLRACVRSAWVCSVDLDIKSRVRANKFVWSSVASDISCLIREGQPTFPREFGQARVRWGLVIRDSQVKTYWHRVKTSRWRRKRQRIYSHICIVCLLVPLQAGGWLGVHSTLSTGWNKRDRQSFKRKPNSILTSLWWYMVLAI